MSGRLGLQYGSQKYAPSLGMSPILGHCYPTTLLVADGPRGLMLAV